MIEWMVKQKWFRNTNHAIWFVGSIGVLGFVMAQRVFPEARWLLIMPIIIHLTPLITAIVKVYYQKQESEVYSKDCIWFNTVIVIIYAVLLANYR